MDPERFGMWNGVSVTLGTSMYGLMEQGGFGWRGAWTVRAMGLVLAAVELLVLGACAGRAPPSPRHATPPS